MGKSGILKRKTSGYDSANKDDFLRGDDNMKTIKEDQMSYQDSRAYSKTNLGDSRIDGSASFLEESLRDGNQPPKLVQGLTQFLIEEFKNKYGIYKRDPADLFIFWKDHVSFYYREVREEKKMKKAQTELGFEDDFKFS